MKVAIIIPIYGTIDKYQAMNIHKIHNDIKYSNKTNDIYDVVLMYDEETLKNKEIFDGYNYTLIPYSLERFKEKHFHVVPTPFKYSTLGNEWKSDMWYYNCQYILPYFYVNNMTYDKYWCMESDVYYSGNYFEYFCDFSNRNDFDFMTCGPGNTKATDGPVKDRTFLSTINFEPDELFVCLNTLHMFTNKALHTLVGYYWTGNDMYFEQFYISLMKKSGYNTGDSLNNKARFSQRKFDDGLDRITFRNNNIPISYDEIIYENTLYHPVKDFSIIYAPWKFYNKITQNTTLPTLQVPNNSEVNIECSKAPIKKSKKQLEDKEKEQK